MASPRMGDPSIIQKQLDEQRDKMGAAPAFGGALPYFLAYDLLVLTTLILIWFVLYVWPRACGGERVWPLTAEYTEYHPLSSVAAALVNADGEMWQWSDLTVYLPTRLTWTGFDDNCTWSSIDISSPLFWSALYNLRMTYGLLCFPFLIFELPLIGDALTKCRATAYDQTGQLVVKLAKGDVATLFERKLHASRSGESLDA